MTDQDRSAISYAVYDGIRSALQEALNEMRADQVSLRDRIAMAALAGMFALPDARDASRLSLAREAYLHADAMLLARDEKTHTS